MELLSVALEAVPKALVYAAVIVSVGVTAARLLYRARVAPSDSSMTTHAGSVAADARIALDAPLSRIACLAAGALLVGLVLRAWGHTAVSFGIADSVVPDNLVLVAWESQWGQAWKLQMAGAAMLAVCAWATTQAPELAWPMTSFVAAGVCYLLPLLGHAEGEPAGVLVHGSHVLGAGLWVGTLMATAFAVPSPIRPAVLRSFAPFAFAGAGALVVSGLIAAWWYLGAPMNLITTTYGWILALKLVFVSDVAILGFLNWRRFHGASSPASGAPHGVADGSREVLVLIEVLMALAVIAVTAVLTETDHP